MSRDAVGPLEPSDPVDPGPVDSSPVDPGPVDAAPVDPLDAGQVAVVVAGTVALMGVEGLVDLLARLPGTRRQPGTPGRVFRSATPAGLWVGTEDLLVLTDPPVHQHVVGGVVLQRSQLTPAQVAPAISQLVVALVRAQGCATDASAALTAARDVLTRL